MDPAFPPVTLNFQASLYCFGIFFQGFPLKIREYFINCPAFPYPLQRQQKQGGRERKLVFPNSCWVASPALKKLKGHNFLWENRPQKSEARSIPIKINGSLRFKGTGDADSADQIELALEAKSTGHRTQWSHYFI